MPLVDPVTTSFVNPCVPDLNKTGTWMRCFTKGRSQRIVHFYSYKSTIRWVTEQDCMDSIEWYGKIFLQQFAIGGGSVQPITGQYRTGPANHRTVQDWSSQSQDSIGLVQPITGQPLSTARQCSVSIVALCWF
jgi:hypothetical protein